MTVEIDDIREALLELARAGRASEQHFEEFGTYPQADEWKRGRCGLQPHGEVSCVCGGYVNATPECAAVKAAWTLVCLAKDSAVARLSRLGSELLRHDEKAREDALDEPIPYVVRHVSGVAS